MVKIVWSLKYSIGNEVSSFLDLATMGVNHFKNLIHADEEVIIAEIIQTAHPFPCFLYENENLDLMEKVSKEELKVILQNFQKDKIPYLDV